MSMIINKQKEVEMEISGIPIGALATYAPQRLHELLAKACVELERAKKIKQWLEAAIALKYEEQIRAKRMRLEKDSGIIHLEDGGYRLTSEIEKKVEWDQQKLAKIATDIMTSGGNLADYMVLRYNVYEHSYNSWSESVRNTFNQARTVKLGKATYKLTKLGEEVAL